MFKYLANIFGKEKSEITNDEPSTLDKYKKWSELCCCLYQRTDLSVPPTWIHAHEDDGYFAESFCVAFDDIDIDIDMSFNYGYFEENYNLIGGKYCYTFSYMNLADNCFETHIIKDDLSDLGVYVKKVNDYFNKKGE